MFQVLDQVVYEAALMRLQETVAARDCFRPDQQAGSQGRTPGGVLLIGALNLGRG
jgi:hypothetical protein